MKRAVGCSPLQAPFSHTPASSNQHQGAGGAAGTCLLPAGSLISAHGSADIDPRLGRVFPRPSENKKVGGELIEGTETGVESVGP